MITLPPRLAERLVARLFADPEWRDSVLGDLAEEYADAAARHGVAAARWWYRRQALGLLLRRTARLFRSTPMRQRLPEPIEPRAGTAGLFWHDVRHAWRSVRHQPALATTIVVVLAVALAANAAVFAMADAIVLRPFRYAGVPRAVVVASDGPGRFFARESVAPGDFLEWREQAGDVFDRLAAIDWWDPNYTHDGPPQELAGFHVSPALFEILGTPAAIGRTLTAADERTGAHVVVLSHAFWVRQFGARPGAVGRAIWLDGAPYDVVGVMPPNFTVPFGADVWAPLVLGPDARAERARGYLMVVARLRPGVAADAADARMQTLLAQEKRAYPDTHAKREVSVRTFTEGFGDPGAGPFVLVWQVASLLLLAVACANVANLLLARNAERERELALRLALGASGGRIAWQLLLESLVLAGLASLLALPLIWAALQGLRGALPDSILRFVPGIAYLGIHGSTFAVTVLLAVVSTVLAALPPAWRASRGSVAESLRPGIRVSDGARRQRGRAILATAQIALTLALLATAGLSLVALRRVTDGPIGFDTHGILTGSVAFPGGDRYRDPETRRQFLDTVFRQLAGLPSVTDVAAITPIPYSGSYSHTSFWPEGVEPTAATAATVLQGKVTPTALPLLKVPLLSGREFTTADTASAPRVALIGARMAKEFWPGRSPLGRRFRLEADGPLVAVVGVVGDVAQDWVGTTENATVYLPMAQDPPASFTLVVRTIPDPAQLTANLRAAVQAADPDQPVINVRTMEKLVQDKTVGLRFAANTLGIIAVVSCLLSSVGLYSLMSFLTTRRTREIGVRMALGATQWDVVRLTARTAAVLTGVGTALGLVLAFLAGRLVERVMFGVVTGDLRVAGGLAVLLAAVSLGASYLPARRAARINPTEALRAE